MFCNKCGASLSEGVSFCANCGNSMTTQSATTETCRNNKKINLGVGSVLAIIFAVLMFIMLNCAPMFDLNGYTMGVFDGDKLKYYEVTEEEILTTSSVVYGFLIASAVGVCVFKLTNKNILSGLFAVINLIVLIIYKASVTEIWKDSASHHTAHASFGFTICVLCAIGFLLITIGESAYKKLAKFDLK